jgi:hypothetical protein
MIGNTELEDRQDTSTVGEADPHFKIGSDHTPLTPDPTCPDCHALGWHTGTTLLPTDAALLARIFQFAMEFQQWCVKAATYAQQLDTARKAQQAVEATLKTAQARVEQLGTLNEMLAEQVQAGMEARETNAAIITLAKARGFKVRAGQDREKQLLQWLIANLPAGPHETEVNTPKPPAKSDGASEAVAVA